MCFDCGSVSEFKIKEDEISYADGSYRNNKNHLNIKSDDENVLPPIDLWSAVSFKRWIHIWEKLNQSTNVFLAKEIKMLDYGGYNGFLPYAFSQKHKINSYVADLDLKGLKMANFLGSKTINLAENKISQMKEAAIKEIKDTSIKIAVDAVKKIITTSVDKSKLDTLFQKNLDESKQELKKINS